MKKGYRIWLFIGIITVIVGFLIGGIVSIYIPRKYDIYLNGKVVENIYAYEHNGHIYLPILGIMEIYGCEINRQEGHDPEFIINDKEYRLCLKENRIYEGENRYLGVSTGQRFLNISNEEVYALVLEIDVFFESIGEEPVAIIATDWQEKRVYLELEPSKS